MREQRMTVNLITYNAAITALSKASRFRMKSSGIQPEEIGSEDLWSRALLLLGQMKKDGIEPDGFCYSSAISCCGAEGRWEEALKLIEVMKQGGPRTRPNKVAYSAAICKYYFCEVMELKVYYYLWILNLSLFLPFQPPAVERVKLLMHWVCFKVCKTKDFLPIEWPTMLCFPHFGWQAMPKRYDRLNAWPR